MNNHMPSKVWDEVSYLYPNDNGEWINNSTRNFMMNVITYPSLYQS